MKKMISLLLILCLLFGFAACQKKEPDPQKVLNVYEKFVEACGKTQVSEDKKLQGERHLSEDAYVGSYLATCEKANGREVIFGGGSLKERTVFLHGTLKTQSGKATLSVRLGEKKQEIPVNEDGSFETVLEMQGGGNYIMLDYADFNGTVTLYADYRKEAE